MGQKDRVEQLQRMLGGTSGNRFVDFDGQTINTADVIGIFTAETMAALTRRKNGQWQCDFGKWHQRSDEGRQEHYWCKKDIEGTVPASYPPKAHCSVRRTVLTHHHEALLREKMALFKTGQK